MAEHNTTKRTPWGLIAGGLIAVAAVVTAIVILDDGADNTSRDSSPNATMGAGFGDDAIRAKVWSRLAKHKDTHLEKWDRALSQQDGSSATALRAFADLVDSVTGPSGFWRDAVPNELLSCHDKPDSPACEGLDAAASEFDEWDLLASKIRRLDGSRADVFLQRNGKDIVSYLDTYVPADASDVAMRQTAFFETKIRKFVATK